MKSAIIVGGSGLIGKHLVRELTSRNLKVLLLGRKPLSLLSFDVEHEDQTLHNYYLDPTNSTNDVSSFLTYFDSLGFEETVFYNLAWRGVKSLADGDLSNQLANVPLSCQLVELASKCKVDKYVASGSMEEIYLERSCESREWLKGAISNSHSNYALAKVAARMQSAFLAYRLRLDFCYTYISIVIDKSLCSNKYIEQSFASIMSGMNINPPKNMELCNIASAEEIARQLYMVGEFGKNKIHYTLGTEQSDTIVNWFDKFAEELGNQPISRVNNLADFHSKIMLPSDFMIANLRSHSKYQPLETVNSLFQSLINLK